MKKTSTLSVYLILLVIAINFKGFAQVPSWWPQNSQTFSNLNNINFADNNTGWFFGDSTSGPVFKRCMVKKTANQGVTWTSQNIGSDSIQILSSYVFNTSTVIAVGKFQTTGGGAIIKTTNGGITWTRDTTSAPERLFDVDFASTNVGWIVGRKGYLGTTPNAGTSWATQTTGTNQDLFGVDFFDLNNGWAVGAVTGTVGTIIHTTNGGTTYSFQTNPSTNNLFAVHAFSATKAIAVGAGGKIVMTTNSGTTWTTQVSGTANDLFDVTFVDPLNGWAVGVGGTIVISTDGGITWAPQTSGTANDIKSISMKNTGLGWLCGLNGTVRYYGISPASVNELQYSYITSSVFPNPINTSATVQINGNFNSSNLMLSVRDIVGHEVKNSFFNGNIVVVERNELNAGMYLYSISNNGRIISTGKLIMQ